jgi:hypothetical protein
MQIKRKLAYVLIASIIIAAIILLFLPSIKASIYIGHFKEQIELKSKSPEMKKRGEEFYSVVEDINNLVAWRGYPTVAYVTEALGPPDQTSDGYISYNFIAQGGGSIRYEILEGLVVKLRWIRTR